MSDDLPITLHASAEETTSGSGTAVDLHSTDGVELRRLARLQLIVSALSGTAPTLNVAIETSPDNATWRQLDSFSQQTAVGIAELKTGDLDRYVRCSWAIGGSDNPTVTFALTGIALATFCTLAELETHGSGGSKLATIAKATRVDKLVAATLTARSYLLKRFQPPLIRVGGDITEAVAKLASLQIFTDRGVNPSPESTALVLDEARNRERWLQRVGSGLAAAEVVDSTPETREGVGAVSAEETRGWGSMVVR